MSATEKLLKVFLDTSALLSGLNSPLGASGLILSFFKLEKIQIVISQDVIEEAERALKNKFPLLRTALLDFLVSHPVITKKINSTELRRASSLLFTEDAPILAGALKGRVDVLVTLDKKFETMIKNKVKFEVLSPGEFLKKYKSELQS
ncbi:hypothetical protein A2757_02125 [Candidatus Giovannonibacteria bacterium RIFCSPHIGHO2_01_FULL_48_47]|nr:MAG: hypothetical protein A2757_02125 [Candidatus Giovannonibacteria bacterium RIFCSPHIGHO2_01_FULL_48_47]OGF69100.1 MAG: hypothetical protein A3D61_03945 [Candidatus Giovannonibacteria bacterium RIFCSPHIGHO2_02_FULL_48_15]OGF88448.1 MAG: hypothetical protein A3B26_01830 [Candidatus Giovannonibacteria bacterium RIFCSPLOWO2_01_FULL_48_47]OGF96522.1 MAG: hypothetical protein A2613_03150 [Candidatus Giovannonibacteria bacterium RIFOXYD1_FULL_48_21]HBT81196.1 hypothetical protein [Candidatus Gio